MIHLVRWGNIWSLSQVTACGPTQKLELKDETEQEICEKDIPG